MGCTIKDIVKDTNLSLATISKYLNGKKILPENQALIEHSIEKLGYVPNKTAQMLRSHKTSTITILLPVLSDYFWGFLCSFIEEYMQNHGYSTMISSYDSTKKDQTEVYHRLLSEQVAGVILIPQNIKQINLTDLLIKKNIPFVYLDQVVTQHPADAVTSNNNDSTFKATRYLLEHGHRNLCVIGGDLTSYTNTERVKGFLRACEEYSIPTAKKRILGGDFSSESAVKSFKKMLALPDRPTAVLFLGYFLTVAAIQELTSLEIKIPDDLSIISFDDDEIFSAFSPPITVILQNLPEMGRQAAKLLLQRIQGDFSDYPKTQIIETQFIERNSVLFL